MEVWLPPVVRAVYSSRLLIPPPHWSPRPAPLPPDQRARRFIDEPVVPYAHRAHCGVTLANMRGAIVVAAHQRAAARPGAGLKGGRADVHCSSSLRSKLDACNKGWRCSITAPIQTLWIGSLIVLRDNHKHGKNTLSLLQAKIFGWRSCLTERSSKYRRKYFFNDSSHR